MEPGSSRDNPIVRPTARVLLLDASDRALLFTATTPDIDSGLPFWFPPGGGVEPGETHEEAAARELMEETGLTVPLGPRLWSRRWLGSLGATWYDVAHAPWVIVVSLTMQGLFSGFIPAAVALTSVSVPDDRLDRALGVVTAGQYLGGTLGPAVGALLAAAFGYRGAIVASAILPAVAATWIIFAVPRDQIGARITRAAVSGRRRFRLSVGWASGFSRTFWVAVLLYFGLFALNQLIRVATPIALKDIAGEDRAATLSGLAFTAAGAGSVAGVIVVARVLGIWTGIRGTLIALTVLSAAATPAMAFGANEWTFIAGLLVFAVANGAAMPATNAMIASTVEVRRRGTAFGLASSAQAIAFMVGPMSAALFAATSLALGFAICGVLFLALGAVVALFSNPPRSGQAAV